MFSVGIDLVEIKRISQSMNNHRFLQKVFGKDEYFYLKEKGFPKQSVAANFCAKEAFSKAIGTGIRGLSLNEVELLRDENGMPYFKFSGDALKIVKGRNLRFSVSVTHTKEYASAVVISWREA